MKLPSKARPFLTVLWWVAASLLLLQYMVSSLSEPASWTRVYLVFGVFTTLIAGSSLILSIFTLLGAILDIIDNGWDD